MSLWAVKRVCLNRSSGYCFSRYNTQDKAISKSTSAAINKWLKFILWSGSEAHSLRHSLRDRMSGGEALSDIIDHIDGWSLKSVGQNYGNSYKLKYMDEWIYNICLQSNS